MDPPHADDLRQFNLNNFDFTDHFDYSHLENFLIITHSECRLLENYALIPGLSNKLLAKNLIYEIRQRILNLYNSNYLYFENVICLLDYNDTFEDKITSNQCERGTFIVGLGTNNDSSAPCASIMSNNFKGCAVIFCVN